MVKVVAGVRPEDHVRSLSAVPWRICLRLAVEVPMLEGHRGEGRQTSLRRDVEQALHQRRREWTAQRKTGDSSNAAAEPAPLADQPECVGVQWTEAPAVIVREELGLVGGDVDVDGAFALAALAGQAQVKRLLHRGLIEPAGDHIALKEFKEQSSSA